MTGDHKDADKLLGALHARFPKHKRVELANLLAIFKESFPLDYMGDTDVALKKMRTLLDQLSEVGSITMPISKMAWDHGQKAPLPKWIKIEREQVPKRVQDWKGHPWRPELDWVSTISNLSDLEMSNLVAINDFFKDVAGSKVDPEPIPIKERSWLLFGDEKRLDTLSGTVLFGEHRLSLEQLRCYRTWEPITYERFSSSREHSVIIIENKDTFHSFTRACKKLGSRSPYTFIIYGRGLAAGSSLLGISMLDDKIHDIDYFGDIDPMGLKIPIDAQQKLVDAHYPQKINPATPFYERAFSMYENGHFKSFTEGRANQWDPQLIDFLPAQFKERATNLFRKGERIPQEIVNYHDILLILMNY